MVFFGGGMCWSMYYLGRLALRNPDVAYVYYPFTKPYITCSVMFNSVSNINSTKV